MYIYFMYHVCVYYIFLKISSQLQKKFRSHLRYTKYGERERNIFYRHYRYFLHFFAEVWERERKRKEERDVRNVLFFPGHVLCAIYPRPFVTRFSRIGLNAIHEGLACMPAPLVLVIVQFAKCAPPRALAYRGNRNYFFRFFFHGKCTRAKQKIRAKRSIKPRRLARNYTFRNPSTTRQRFFSFFFFVSFQNNREDTIQPRHWNFGSCIHRFLCPLTFPRQLRQSLILARKTLIQLKRALNSRENISKYRMLYSEFHFNIQIQR